METVTLKKKSSYLEAEHRKYMQEAKNEESQLTSSYHANLKYVDNDTGGLFFDFIIGGVVGIVLGIILAIKFPHQGLLWVTPIICGFLAVIFRGVKNNSNRGDNAKIERELRSECQKVWSRKNAEYAKVEENYYKNVKDRQAYYGSLWKKLPEVYNWLVEGFSQKIDCAPRARHIKFVSAEYRYTVHETGIMADNGSIRHEHVRIHNMPEKYDQAGFAQAMAIVVVSLMRNKYPYDVSDPTHTSPTIDVLSNNDGEIVLFYSAPNGNYEHFIA